MTNSDSSTLSVAFVTQRFPPMDSTGTIRVSSLRGLLNRYGIAAKFVTIPVEWMRQQSSELALRDSSQSQGDVVQPRSRSDLVMRFMSRVPLLRRLQRWLFVPDILVMWARTIGRTLAPALAGVDAVYATGPPYSAYTAGRLLSHRLGVPLILELRDPPVLGRRRGPLYMRRLAAFERRQLVAANKVVTLTPGVKRHLLATYSWLSPDQIVVVPNGSGSVAGHQRAAKRLSSSQRLSMVYAGSLRGAQKVRLLRVVAESLGRLPTPGILHMIGDFDEPVRDALSQLASVGAVTWRGRLTRDEALEEIRNSDASLVLASESEKWWIGRKVVESLVHAPQILAVVPEGDVAELLDRSSKSVVVHVDQLDDRVDDALALLSERAGNPAMLVGPEPVVPSDLQVAEGVANVIRAALTGEAAEDWDWSRTG